MVGCARRYFADLFAVDLATRSAPEIDLSNGGEPCWHWFVCDIFNFGSPGDARVLGVEYRYRHRALFVCIGMDGWADNSCAFRSQMAK